MADKKKPQDVDVVVDLKTDLIGELDQCQQSIKEINLLLEQSQGEFSKLTKKNATVTSQLQQTQTQVEYLPISDVKIAYDSALEAQQRLFVMRGQMDKLQSDLTNINKYTEMLKRVINVLEDGSLLMSQARGSGATVETLEMVIQAQEAERQRLSRQMHDGPAQALSNFILQTEIAMRLFDIDEKKALEELSSLKLSASNAFQQVRDFIFDLRPMMLDDLGLGPTLKKYVDAYRMHPGIEIGIEITGADRRLESYLEVLVFRAIQELLGNAIRHSQASKIKVILDIGDLNIKVVVDDNGKGFDTGLLEERSNMGLRVVKERVEMLGGEFETDSIIGQGTQIMLQIPAHNVTNLT